MNELLLSGVFYISPEELVVHRKLIDIYSEYEVRPDLEEDISKRGVIINALVVSRYTGKNVVLSGKCRRQIAIKLGLSTIPVRFIECTSPEDEEAWVLALNYNRDGKTNYQKMVEAEHWERHFKPLARKNKEASAEYARKFLVRSNLTEPELTDRDLDIKRINVRDEVAKKLKIGAGTYSNSKQVYQRILVLREQGKLNAADVLEKELNRSIDGAYKFVCDKNTYNQVIDLLELGEIGNICDALAWVRSGERNPFRQYKPNQVYLFSERVRPDLEVTGRVVKITNEFVVFGFRNLVNMTLEIINLRPKQINAQLVEEPSMSQRERILRADIDSCR
jgi:ParB-like chromosome segregation protein Spo0J